MTRGENIRRRAAGHVPGLVLDTGYRAVVLDRMVRRSATLLGASEAWVLVRDHDRPEVGIVAAETGLEYDFVGRVVDLRADPPAPMAEALWSEVPPPFGARGRLAVSGGAHGEDAQRLLDQQAERVNAALDHAPIPRSMAERILKETEQLARSVAGDSPASEVELELALALADELGLDAADRVEVELAARLYPIGHVFAEGKNGSSDDRSDDPDRAANAARVAADTAVAVPGLEPLAAILFHLEERYDGSGRPAALAGERIPVASRIVSCARAFRAAMTRSRAGALEVVEGFAAEAVSRFGDDVASAVERAVARDQVPN